MQKKITPWTNPGSVAVELFPGSSSTVLASVQHPSFLTDLGSRGSGGLVLVASLLNKIPNLGGEDGVFVLVIITDYLSAATTN